MTDEEFNNLSPAERQALWDRIYREHVRSVIEPLVTLMVISLIMLRLV